MGLSVKYKEQEWLEKVVKQYLITLAVSTKRSWEEYKTWLEQEGIWAFLGGYGSTPQGEFLHSREYNCEFYDCWTLLIWVDAVWYFNGDRDALPPAGVISKIGEYFKVKSLSEFLTKRSKNRKALLQNPALQGALALAELSGLINWLETKDREQNLVRQKSFKWMLLAGEINLAWADGTLLFDEKEGIRYQIDAAGLDGEMTDYLLKLLVTKPDSDSSFQEYLQVLKNSKLSTLEKRILIIVATIASLLDGEQAASEKEYLNQLGLALGVEHDFIERMAIDVTKYLADNPAVNSSEVSWFWGRLQRKITSDLAETLQQSAAKIWQEVQETGDLCLLLGRAAKGYVLTEDEMARVKNQLTDIAKVVPALAIFMLPGGMVFLGVLLKVLPFNILPSSFTKKKESHEIK